MVEAVHDTSISRTRLKMADNMVMSAHVTTKHDLLSPESKLARKRSKPKEFAKDIDDKCSNGQTVTKKNKDESGETLSPSEHLGDCDETLADKVTGSQQNVEKYTGDIATPQTIISSVSYSQLSNVKLCQNALGKIKADLRTIGESTVQTHQPLTVDSKLQNASLQLKTSPAKDLSGINSLHQLLSHNNREQTAVMDSSGSTNNPVFTNSQSVLQSRSSLACTGQTSPKIAVTSAVTTLFSTSPVPSGDLSLSSKNMIRNPDPKHNLYIKCFDSEGKQLLVPYTCIKQLPVASTSLKTTPSVPGQQVPIPSAKIANLSSSITTLIPPQSGSSILPQLSLLTPKTSSMKEQQLLLSSTLPNIPSLSSVCIPNAATTQNLILSSSPVGSVLKKTLTSPVKTVGSNFSSTGKIKLSSSPSAHLVPSTTLSQEKNTLSSVGMAVIGHGSASEVGICTQPLLSTPRSELLVTSSTSIVVSTQQNNNVFKKPLKVTSRGLQSILKSSDEEIKVQNRASPKSVSLLNPNCRLQTSQKSVAVVAPMSKMSISKDQAAANDDKEIDKNNKSIEHGPMQVSEMKQIFGKESNCMKSSFITIDGTKSAFNYLTDSQSQRIIGDQLSATTSSRNPLGVTTVFPGQSISSGPPTNPIILIPVSVSNQAQESSRSASPGVVSLLKNFQLKKSSQQRMNSGDDLAGTKTSEIVKDEIKLDKRIIVVNKSRKGKEVQTPVEDLEPLRSVLLRTSVILNLSVQSCDKSPYKPLLHFWNIYQFTEGWEFISQP